MEQRETQLTLEARCAPCDIQWMPIGILFNQKLASRVKPPAAAKEVAK